MSASLLSTFERYQQARVAFVQAVAEAATRPANVDVMQNAGVMQLLRPLPWRERLGPVARALCSVVFDAGAGSRRDDHYLRPGEAEAGLIAASAALADFQEARPLVRRGRRGARRRRALDEQVDEAERVCCRAREVHVC